MAGSPGELGRQNLYNYISYSHLQGELAVWVALLSQPFRRATP
jgi:hypothetical protein